MINRTLIRLKVVQLMYAHLLRRFDFNIAVEPKRGTREALNTFELYSNAIALLLLSTAQGQALAVYPSLRGISIDHAVKVKGDLLNELSRDDKIKTLLHSDAIRLEVLRKFLPDCCRKITSSKACQEFQKKRSIGIEDEISFWNAIVSTEIIPALAGLLNENSDSEISSYSINQARAEIKSTLEDFANLRTSFLEARNSLQSALNKAYNLYMALLWLPVELVKERSAQLEAARNKYLPSPEDLNPNTRFIDSSLIEALSTDEYLQDYIQENPVSWDDDPKFLSGILNDILASEYYKNYIAKETVSVNEECEFWQKIFEKVILPSDALAEILENKSIYWNDDLSIVGSFVVKTFSKGALNNGKLSILPKYKDEEDSRFGSELFTYAYKNYSEYREYIDRFVNKNWDPERIAFMDIVIMVTAVAELLNFPLIPLPVTMNQYTDIAADYSTPRSGQFVNGLLFALSQELKKEGKIFK